MFQILFVVYVLGMTLMEFASCVKKGCLKCGGDAPTHWDSVWKGLDSVNLVFFYASICLFASNEVYRTGGDVDWFSTERYVSFRKLQYGFTMESYCAAINGALLWFKLFKYLAVHKRLRFLFTMLNHSSPDLVMFAIVLLVFIISFGTAGFMTFKSDVDDFRSYTVAMANMMRFTMVDMDYGALTLSSRAWGSLFYFVWSLLMLLILANVYICLLINSENCVDCARRCSSPS